MSVTSRWPSSRRSSRDTCLTTLARGSIFARMRHRAAVTALSFSLSLLAACGSDSSDPPAGGAAGSGAGGSPGAGSGGSPSSGGASSGGASSGGASSGGAAGSTGALVDLAGCTEATASDKSGGGAIVTAGAGGPKYSPACLKIKVGESIEFKGTSSIHPLVGMTTVGTQPNPIGPESTVDKTVKFDAPGSFGFYCTNHGGDGASSGMVGAVYVLP